MKMKIINWMGSTELAANYLNTQTEDVLDKRIQGEDNACDTHCQSWKGS